MRSVLDSTAVREGGVGPQGAGAAAVELRQNILSMTQTAEDAVLAPQECGAWPADLRAALAARIARLNGAATVAGHYADRMDSDDFCLIADPDSDGRELGLAAVVGFMDKVAMQAREVVAEDIRHLQDDGIRDADIVRLCELNAFLAYQLRLIAGLRLMTDVQT